MTTNGPAMTKPAQNKLILFLTLKVFSATGGIEKVCRVAGKALFEYGLKNNIPVRVYSMHGPRTGAVKNKYFPTEIFRGFNSARTKFVIRSVLTGRKSHTVILSHINLLLAGWLIKKLRPSVNLILIAHGIEVWKPLSRRHKMMLRSCDHIVSVSRFTADKIKELHGIAPEKLGVLNNCIDPFLEMPEETGRNSELMKRYGFAADDIILLTLTRLSEKDRYKGYDYVLQSMQELIRENKKIKYLLAGSYSEGEKEYIDGLVDKLGIGANVVLSGYVKEDELPAHFSLADIYVMPSVKEGFGIVFVEAMYYGVPAIAANADGSVDALLNGQLGLLIEPADPKAITVAIKKMLADRNKYIPDHDLLMEHFGYEHYKEELEAII